MVTPGPLRWLTIAAIAAGLFVAAAGCSERESGPADVIPTTTPPSATSTPTAVPSPTSTPSPTPTPAIDGVELRTLTDGPLTRLEGYAVIVEVGCWGCDGPANGLVRYYEAPDGSFRQDALFRGPVNPDQYITGIAFRPGTQAMAISVCTSGYCGRVDNPTGDAEVTLFESLDGGVTWEVIGQHAGAVSVTGYMQDDWLLARFQADVTAELDFFLARSGDAVDPPDGTRGEIPPRFVVDDDALWMRDDGEALLRADGTLFFETPLEGMFVGGVAMERAPAGRVAVTWYPAERSGTTSTSYLTIIEGGRARLHLVLDRELVPWYWVEGGRLLANVWDRRDEPGGLGTQPVIIDLEDATIRPLDGPFGRGQGGSSLGDLIGRNFVRMAYAGPFARVLGPACTEVFEEPGSKSLGCFAPGVLLAHEGALRSEGERQWLRVRTPLGAIGWATTEFLEW